MDFLEQMETDIIPRVGIMIKKEKEHINHLKYKKEVISNHRFLYIFKVPMYSTIMMIDDCIKKSEEILNNLEMRHFEYIEYVKLRK